MMPILLVASILVLAGLGGEPGTQPSGATDVVLNVIALDRKGNPVTDLRVGELQVFEDGVRQPLVSFERQESASPPVAVLMDALNTYLGARERAIDGILAALRQLPPAQTVSLYVLSVDGTLHAVRESGVRQSLDRVLRSDTAIRPDYLRQSDRAKATYAALKQVAEPLAALPGRKAIVWVSHGIPAYAEEVNGAHNFEPVLERFAAAFGQAEIAIYSVAQSADATPSGMTDRWSLKPLSSLTGGRSYPSDHVEEAVLQAVADSRVTYRLVYRQPAGKAGASWWQYRPSASTSGSGYRKLRLVCARAGVRVLSRQGYYLPSPARKP
jgi:VWFA-related protein